MKTLCERLKRAMTETGITTQSDLARRSGVNQSIISKILAGKNETSKYSGRLAAALGISADWLINGTGSMSGGLESVPEKLDASRAVTVWDENGSTPDVISWTESVPPHYRAYIMKKNTGIMQAPAGSVVLVDPTISPGNNELVVTVIRGEASVYRFLDGGSGYGFLSVDDERIPVTEIKDSAWVVGVAEQILVRKLRK
ncbi:helix-turn-helix domain-containing protein [Serratia marcescens]|uniref:Helix-turn-helix domain-containing protein n=1 Tax=Serratia marcescens TaxID=615 RepID=A0ABD6HMU5_SERMA|nr:helix-turn-helix domain-containing protein [Serratia marcescens]MVF02765.1 helix-turn-helix domain-containing protein [Serratia marcescens]